MMNDKRTVDELSVEELKQLLYQKKWTERRQRLQRLKKAGRLIEVAGRPPPNPTPPPLARPAASPTGAMRRYALDTGNGQPSPNGITAESTGETVEEQPVRRPVEWRWVFNKLLLIVEIAAVLGLIAVGFSLWRTTQELNQELAQVQRAESASVALPTATPTPIIGVVVLPGGHKPPVEGRPIDFSEAGDIPAHLLPLINAYVPPPVPTPGPEQARRIQIPAINVDAPIFQGDDQETLKKGVGQHIGSALPGKAGNLVLSAHNDIYGEIFRHLDKLNVGDEIVVSSERQSYVYVVRKLDVVEPTEVWVMAPTEHASTTLISCYPWRVNSKRIIVFADLVDGSLSSH